MRKRFIQGNELDSVRIADVEIDERNRHQLAPVLVALQHIFVTPETNKKVFKILDEKIGRSDLGREGMSHWEILVLGVIRLTLGIDYDFLQDQANQHMALRSILGVETKNVFSSNKQKYSLQTLKDNVSLLDEETLSKISDIVVGMGHSLLKKNDEPLEINAKVDSYPVEANIHFPTDIGLMYDSGRKCVDIFMKLSGFPDMKGIRKSKYLQRKFKKSYQKCADIHRRKGANYKKRLADSVVIYLKFGENLLSKISDNQEVLDDLAKNYDKEKLVSELFYFGLMLRKHIDLVDRRLLQGETIPHCDKVFSVFQPEVEWINKGKTNKKVELGHNVVISTDQFHFILDHKVAVKQTDNTLALEVGSRIAEKFDEGYKQKSISFDRGFYNTLGKNGLEAIFETVVMPKPGKKSRKTQEEESADLFILLKSKHCAVESNINELEHTGVDKVPDRGLPAFKRYVAYGVLAYNLKRLGKLIKEQKKTSSQESRRTSWKKAA